MSDTVTVRSLEFKQVSLPRPVVSDGAIKGRGKDEAVNAREQAAFAGSVDEAHVVKFTDGVAKVSPAVAEALVEFYPKSVFIVAAAPAKGK